MKTFFHSRFAFNLAGKAGLAFAMLSLAALSVAPILAPAARAQAVHGIPSAGTDFYLSRMPILPFSQSWQAVENGPLGGYFLIGSLQNNNQVTIDYFEAGTGKEQSGKTFILQRGMCTEYAIDPNSMTPSRPGEFLEWKSAHITSTYPITVQYYCEGTSEGSLYSGIPTAALGKNYVIAAWNDCPHADAPNPDNPDSTSSEFMVIAAYDNTSVTITTNSTTYGGQIGVNTGAGNDGTTHPKTITMNRGQIYWVRSEPTDIANDLSGSLVSADKPVAVIGGQERAFINDPESTGSYGDEDIRNALVEEMTPVESWGTDYPMIPTMPASNPNCNSSGDGDLYRIYSNDPNGMSVNMWQYVSPAQQYGPQGAKLYQAPIANWQNITESVDLLSASKDAQGNLKKIYAVQYQYFQWVPEQEESYRNNEDMDVIPIDHYMLNTVFMVPHNVHYNGYQFINIITNKDSLTKINIFKDGNLFGTLKSSIPPSAQYQIPLHPELIGLTFKLIYGSYLITGNTPFACYSYGRTETDEKTISGYDAPTGQVYGSHDVPYAPKADVTPSCGAWHVHVYEPSLSGNDGIADLRLLDDPDGLYSQPPSVSYNCLLNPQDPTLPPFVVGDENLTFDVLVQNPADTADAYIYVVDRAGNDTVIHLHYVPSQFSFSKNTITFPDTVVGTTQTRTFTFHVLSTGNFTTIQIPPAFLMGLDTLKDFSFTSNPTLPATMKTGDSIVFTVQFSAVDTNFHIDNLVLSSSCVDDTVALRAHQVTPIIVASDQDFGTVPVGDTVCYDLNVKNIGDANLILDSNYVLHLNPDYTFKGPVPDTIPPGGTLRTLHFCFHPSSPGSSNSRMDWGTNLNYYFAHNKKDTSQLLGYGIAPGMNWDRRNQLFTVECDAYDTVRVNLLNSSSASNGASVNVNDIHIEGDASEFTILDYGIKGGGAIQYSTQISPFVLYKDTSYFVDVQFKANLANGYANRSAQIIANGVDAGDASKLFADTISFTGIVRHANVTIAPATFNFGPQSPGTQLTQKYTITNTGDTAFVFTGITLSGSQDFTILSGPAVGSSLLPNMTDTFVIQYTAAQTGGVVNALLQCNGDFPCASGMATAIGASEAAAVAEIVPTYPITYICHNDSASITVANKGSVGVILDSVQILNGNLVYPAANEFKFFATNSQLIAFTPGMGMDTNQTATFPVQFTPGVNESVAAQSVFYWEDTSKGQQRYFQDTLPITGTGYQTSNTVSLQNPTASAPNTYTAVTAKQVSIPVQLTAPFDSIAQVYGVQFTLRYYRDAFQFQNVVPVAGMSLVNNPQFTPDPSDNNYELLSIHVASTSPIRNSGTFATVNLQYVVAKDSISPFNVGDVMFLDNTGASECWVDTATQPTQFYGQNLCGDATLRMYLHGGMPAFSIQGVTPNPVRHTANVYYKVAEDGVPVTMQVFNALGQPVVTLMKDEPHAVGSYSVTMDASQLPSGLYTVYISTPGFGISKQVVVTK